eukprot:gene10139-8040_t
MGHKVKLQSRRSSYSRKEHVGNGQVAAGISWTVVRTPSWASRAAAWVIMSDSVAWRPRTKAQEPALLAPIHLTLLVRAVEDPVAEGSYEEDISIVFDYQGDASDDVYMADDGSSYDAETNAFDSTVSVLEDVMLDPVFEQIRENFCKEHCTSFEDPEENKLEQTLIFEAYTQLVEAGIESRLKAVIPGFDMASLLGTLQARKEEFVSDIYDLLLSIVDFESFKETMIAYKQELRNGNTFQIHITPLCLHSEEQEDVELRPDLDQGLTVSPIGSGPNTLLVDQI